MGKYERLVGVAYSTDRPEVHYFDEHIRMIHARLGRVLADRNVTFVGESWDQRFYLIHASGDRDPGRYYRFDTQQNQLASLYDNYPALKDEVLPTRTAITYPSRDGVVIPGYLSRPNDDATPGGPAIVLPHGGPESRDEWGFDWLSQYLATLGYSVLQSNFRGSGGYGDAWAGVGGFRNWQRAINDITDGAQWLVDEGIADPDRICVIGWSYGGYAALMSAVEEPDRYQCAISIAGVVDPGLLIEGYRYFRNKHHMREFIGTDPRVLNRGSALKRVAAIDVPVLLFHGDRDTNVPVRHSKKMHNALRRADKVAELVIYEGTAHSIRHDDYRIDMLTKMGEFLDRNIGNVAQDVVDKTDE